MPAALIGAKRLTMVTGLVTAITQWPLAELPPIVKG